MDSLYWANLNSNIKHETTKKQYYSRYLWRQVYKIKKVCLASDKHVSDVSAYVKAKQEDAQRWADRAFNTHRLQEWSEVDAELLDHVRTVMNNFKDTMKFRCEWNTMQIYAETEEDLKRVAAVISHDQDIVIINSPIAGTEDALRNGVVYMNKIDYKYKIILRDGNYDTQTKQSILNQLLQRDDVKIPSNLYRELGKKYPALWGAYFYTNDDSIVTILSLISPGLVGKIHPIDHLQ